MSLQTPTLEKVVPQTDNFSGYFTDDPLKISEIYRKNINISIWQRELNSKLIQAGEYILQENPELQLSEVVDPGNINEIMIKDKTAIRAAVSGRKCKLKSATRIRANGINTNQPRFITVDKLGIICSGTLSICLRPASRSANKNRLM